jgi:hypothetical protein
MLAVRVKEAHLMGNLIWIQALSGQALLKPLGFAS